MATSISQALGVAPPPTRQAALPVQDAGAGYEAQATLKRKELEPLQQRISEAQTEATKLAGEKATFQTEQKAKQAAGESQAMRAFEERVQAAPMRPMLEQKTAQEKDFFFRPSQEDGLMMAGLASLITVLGTAVGKGGKGYAQAALAGMNGMMQGYRQGRDDVFRQEKIAFETNARALRDQISSMRQALQDYEKEAARDRDGALLRLREKLTQEGADFAAARVNRQGVAAMLPELMRQEKALNDQIGRYEMKATDARTRAEAAEAARVAREEAAVREQQFRQQMQEDRLRVQQQLQQQRIEAAVDRAAARPEKPPRQISDTQVVKLEGLESIASGLEKLKKSFKPEFASLGVLGVGADLELEARRRLGDTLGTEATRWWAAYNRLQAPNRHALFGATLTGNELKNYQSFTAKPGDSAEFVRGMLDDQITYSRDLRDTRLTTYEAAGYKIPERKPPEYEKSFSGAPAAAPAAPAAAGPKEGDKATSKSGRPMVYRGGQWVYE